MNINNRTLAWCSNISSSRYRVSINHQGVITALMAAYASFAAGPFAWSTRIFSRAFWRHISAPPPPFLFTRKRRSRVGSSAYQVFGASIIIYIRIALTLYCFFDFSLCLDYLLAPRRPRYLRPVQALHRAVCLSLLPHTSRQFVLYNLSSLSRPVALCIQFPRFNYFRYFLQIAPRSPAYIRF